MSVSSKILDAIELLSANSIQKAGYDKTIQAQIVSCEDATIGKYRCRYQDAVFYAYSNGADVSYTNGAYVYILVPGNDMSKEKTILGTTKKLGINYISQAEGEQAYEIIGNNCISSDRTFYLDTNNQDYSQYLYNSKTGSTNYLNLDIEGLNRYLKQSFSLIVGGSFKTSIPRERQRKGHYGIRFGLVFTDNAKGEEVTRVYELNENYMEGNPYRLIYDTPQQMIQEIDGQNFKRVEYIQLYNNSFPGATGSVTTGILSSGDIEIHNLEIKGANRLSEEEINGVAVVLETPQGDYFSALSDETSYKTIVAQVRVKGKLVSESQNLQFFWGKQHVGVTAKSKLYNQHLGRGWQCLNDYNEIYNSTDSEDSEDFEVEWIPYGNTFIVKYTDVTYARNTRFKVAVLYDGNVIFKTIDIKNLAAETPELTIVSSDTTATNDGVHFYNDRGHPTLTCKINGTVPSSGYQYSWWYEPKDGIGAPLLETTEENTNYDNAVNALQAIKDALSNRTRFINEAQADLIAAQETVDAFSKIQRVKDNQVFDVQIGKIDTFGTFICQVFQEVGDKTRDLGTASIKLYNEKGTSNTYSLIINNGSVVYQYNENGIAPNNKSLDNPQKILGLSFSLYDNLGQLIDSEELLTSSNCSIRWMIPTKNTLLIDKNQVQDESTVFTDPITGYRYYDNLQNFLYDIESQYDINKYDNQIELTIKYKDEIIKAKTNLTFTKQGEPGTNGTKYTIKIIPNTVSSNPPMYPMITKTKLAGTNTVKYRLNYPISSSDSDYTDLTNLSSFTPFVVQIYRLGELVWNSKTGAVDGEFENPAIGWSILKNTYATNVTDDSDFIIDAATGAVSLNDFLFDGTHHNWTSFEDTFEYSRANIFKCEIVITEEDGEQKTYYGTIPMITAWVEDDTVRISLKEGTGFKYALYESDGTRPKYNTIPFEFIFEEHIKNYWEDISTITDVGQEEVYVEFTPGVVGDTKIKTGTSTYSKKDSKLLTIQGWDSVNNTEISNNTYRKDLKRNQWKIIPVNKYDGSCVNNAVTCVFKQYRDGVLIPVAKMRIPVHLLLNRYGFAHLNAWDGNSIQINEDEGYILSPQMGAGQKQADNSFTGVLMGKVEIPSKGSITKTVNGKTKSYPYSETGLFGYSSGDRTFFLNSENGSAIFGKSGDGQIIIDPDAPDEKKALLYSHNFWKAANYGLNGLPTSYDNSAENGEGLLINLSKPQIRFGNGNFYITKDGKLHATEAQISGAITATSLTLGSGVKISTSDIDGLDEGLGVYIRKDGVISSIEEIDIWDAKKTYYMGDYVLYEDDLYRCTASSVLESIPPSESLNWRLSDDEPNLFVVSSDGLLQAHNAIISGTILASSGKVGGWTIKNNNLYTGTQGSSGSVYLTPNGSSNTIAEQSSEDWGITLGSNFGVTRNGNMYSKSGKIGGWTINSNSLTATGFTLSSNGSMTGGTTNTWTITQSGNATFNHLTANGTGSIGGWTIGTNTLSNGNITLNASSGSIFSSGWGINGDGSAWFNNITATGRINATSGTIGGWDINKLGQDVVGLKAGETYFNATGGMSGPTWSIDADGTATFNNITANSGSIAGWTIGQVNANGSTGISCGVVTLYSLNNFTDEQGVTGREGVIEGGTGGGFWRLGPDNATFARFTNSSNNLISKFSFRNGELDGLVNTTSNPTTFTRTCYIVAETGNATFNNLTVQGDLSVSGSSSGGSATAVFG